MGLQWWPSVGAESEGLQWGSTGGATDLEGLQALSVLAIWKLASPHMSWACSGGPQWVSTVGPSAVGAYCRSLHRGPTEGPHCGGLQSGPTVGAYNRRLQLGPTMGAQSGDL